MTKEKEPSWPIIDGKQVFERPGIIDGYHELFFHPDLMAKLKKKADKLGIATDQLIEKIVSDNVSKKFDIPVTDYEALEQLGKRHGLTVNEAAEVSMLFALHKDNVKVYEAAKKTVDARVVKVAEKIIGS